MYSPPLVDQAHETTVSSLCAPLCEMVGEQFGRADETIWSLCIIDFNFYGVVKGTQGIDYQIFRVFSSDFAYTGLGRETGF